MAQTDWQEVLGWSQEQLKELSYAGFSLLMEGQYEKAATLFEALTILERENPYNFQTLGALYLQMSQDAKALPLLDKALALEPNHEATLLNKVKALLATNQLDEAMQLAKKLTKSQDPTICGDAEALLLAYV